MPEFASAHAASNTESQNPCAARSDTAVFQIAPHQRFVRSFMSASTPYNGLLLFHGLGSGKTCAAMQVAEETFNTSARNGTPRRTYVVAAPTLQAQFKANLYDADKLVQRNGVWTMPGCVAPELLREALPDPRTVEPKESIVRRLAQAVHRRYAFVGPDQLANMVSKVVNKYNGIAAKQKRLQAQRAAITEHFGNRLYVVDEAHDLRMSGPSSSKRAWTALERIAKDAEGTKLLLLTATPVFDAAADIVSLLNLLLLNDGRKALRTTAYFTSKGAVLDGGAQRLAKAASGYVSFVSSQDTEAYPYLLSPDQFGYVQPDIPPPDIGFRGDDVSAATDILNLATVSLSAYQGGLLAAIQEQQEEVGKGLGHTELAKTIMALNFVYPGYRPGVKPGPEAFISAKGLLRCVRNLSGTGGRRRLSGPYIYDVAVEREYGDMFALPNLGEYSAKMARILEETNKGAGIVLIYSQYLESGAVPIALSLERAGYVRRDGPALWDAQGPAAPLEKGGYVLITGDATLSPNNQRAVALATAKTNTRGEEVKVVVISQTGSQGVDLRNVRQTHLLDPWYNLGRVEQIVGRARRRCSHISLPPEERNVSVYLYATRLRTRREAPDYYVYSLAARKAIEGGEITRALKEHAIDCWVSGEGNAEPGTEVAQVASNGTPTRVSTAPKSYSFACDYQASCGYRCAGRAPVGEVRTLYSDRLIEIAGPPLLAALRGLFANRVHYSRDELHSRLGEGAGGKGYTSLQIDAALTALVTQPEQWVVNPRGLPGHIQNIGTQYLFVPAGLEGARLSIQDRLAGGVTVPQAVEVEPPKVKLGVAKVYTDASDGLKLAKVIIRRAAREPKYMKVPKGQHDIAWGHGAINSMYDDRGVMRARNIINDPEAPSALPTHVVMREVEMLSLGSKLALLRAGVAGKLAGVEDNGELRVLAALRSLGGPYRTPPPLTWTGTFVFGDIASSTAEYYTVGPEGEGERVRRAAASEVAEFHASRAELPPPATVHGTIWPHKGQYLVFRVVDTRARSAQTGWQCTQGAKQKVLGALGGVVGPDKFTTDNTQKLGSARELCIDLEVILRYYQARGDGGRQWIYTFEQALMSRAAAN